MKRQPCKSLSHTLRSHNIASIRCGNMHQSQCAEACHTHLAASTFSSTRCGNMHQRQSQYANVCRTHLAAPMSPAYNVDPLSPAYNVETHIKDKYAKVCLTHLAAPMSPAAWRHLSPGDILFAASGVAGSWPDSERTVPPELLVCSFLPTTLGHLSSVKWKENKRKDYAFRRQFNKQPSSIPGCPVCKVDKSAPQQ